VSGLAEADLPRTEDERRNATGVAAWDAIIAGIASAGASRVAEEGGASGVPARRAAATCGCAADHGPTYVRRSQQVPEEKFEISRANPGVPTEDDADTVRRFARRFSHDERVLCRRHKSVSFRA
jgi:hypothetical protein